jgi:photosynthetic reaction center H subunit
MGKGAITQYFDVAQLVLYIFWIFFAGLIYYLIREGHREGYPMDHSDSDNTPIEGWPRAPAPKTYLLEDGREIQIPRDESDSGNPPLNAQPVYKTAHSPLEPTGDPLKAGVGPGAWSTLRPDEADLDHHGEPKIVPLSMAPEFGVSSRDPDPRGLPLIDAAGAVAGTVRDLWIDRGEMALRYIEAEVAVAGGGTRRVLVPMPFASVTRAGTQVDALYAEQFAGVPPTRATDRVTLLEEERIGAYYGAGTLYADPTRAEPMV